jgi:hypothetical protein
MIEVVLNDRLGKKIRVKCKCVRTTRWCIDRSMRAVTRGAYDEDDRPTDE